nr:DUF4113 domain-containing protein [Marinobacterium iners]
MFDTPAASPGSRELMQVLDHINKSGHEPIFFAGQGMRTGWAMKREWLSPTYTTRWEDIPCVR